jgi:hypothetical protein
LDDGIQTQKNALTHTITSQSKQPSFSEGCFLYLAWEYV